MIEEWKQIPGYENYEISNEGLIRKEKPNGEYFYLKCSCCYEKNAYYMFTVSKKARLRKLYLHRVLADLFLPNDNPSENPDVCFKDGNVHNVQLSNLYWSNQKARMGRRKAEGGYEGYTSNHKLSVEDVRKIRELKPTMSYRKLAEMYNVHQWSIFACVKRITWKHIE
jgi:hypothetical protein